MKKYQDDIVILKEGYTPHPCTWHKIEDCLPCLNPSEEIYGKLCSKTVLVYSKSGYHVASLQKWDDDVEADNSLNWIESGIDSYSIDNVLYWRSLPVKPI